jgi:hypothetical protein
LTSEQALVAAVAASDAALVQDQIAVFKALGGSLPGCVLTPSTWCYSTRRTST